MNAPRFLSLRKKENVTHVCLHRDFMFEILSINRNMSNYYTSKHLKSIDKQFMCFLNILINVTKMVITELLFSILVFSDLISSSRRVTNTPPRDAGLESTELSRLEVCLGKTPMLLIIWFYESDSSSDRRSCKTVQASNKKNMLDIRRCFCNVSKDDGLGKSVLFFSRYLIERWFIVFPCRYLTERCFKVCKYNLTVVQMQWSY